MRICMNCGLPPQKGVKERVMPRKVVLSLGITLIALLSFGTMTAVFASSNSTGQFVAYKVTATNSTGSFSATVNETVAPSTSVGLSDLTFQLISSMSNFTFSKIVNSSQVLLPYLPAIGNKSFSYQGSNYSMSLSIVKTGASTVTFSRSPYTVTEYSFELSGARMGGASMSVSGQLIAFPSGLVYSATVNSSGYNVLMQLIETNLQLSSSSSSSAANASVLIAGGFGTFAAGMGTFAIYKKRNGDDDGDRELKELKEKPLYHVD